VRAAVRVRAVVQRVCSGVAPEAESPATIPGVRKAVRWRACGSLGRQADRRWARRARALARIAHRTLVESEVVAQSPALSFVLRSIRRWKEVACFRSIGTGSNPTINRLVNAAASISSVSAHSRMVGYPKIPSCSSSLHRDQ